VATEQGLAAIVLPQQDAADHVEVQEPTRPGSRAEAILDAAEQQLRALFRGDLQAFELPLDLGGATVFQRAVLLACFQVPYGQVVSYGELARRAGFPGAARAVGQVMARNPLPLVIPCHRVIASDGGLTGFGGGLPLKERLLAMEREGLAPRARNAG
jgi:methylated-DNA-[protein]-cysteine S-methyltransferase